MNIKTLITTLGMLCFAFSICCAQNSVTVRQNGNNNTVSINQSGKSGSIDSDSSDSANCDEAIDRSASNKNVISLKESREGKTLFQTQNEKNNAFYLNQTGGQGYSVLSLQGITDMIAANQKGKNNGIYLFLNPSDSLKRKGIDSIKLSQQGRANTIRIGPCKESGRAIKRDVKNFDIRQQGGQNKATISIHNNK